ncbi:hypothetical protein HPB47_005328 [Ixodes persulcatus]|uniref:Uncharacterized protein n=1 Tax=Ixodes persulcatus TaxID=34615 RepID=A0AC60PD88_IXOPE|nr:hypothetical protein HPB47_005328 [Ixodes persulcatus]
MRTAYSRPDPVARKPAEVAKKCHHIKRHPAAIEGYTLNATRCVFLKRFCAIVAASTWLFEQNATIASRLNRHLRALLGMGTLGSNYEAEPYQLANYGTGGHYLPHHDYLYDVYEGSDETDGLSRFPSYGDRLATLMIYMSDVEEGGATVFPKLGVRLTPKKGDAAFWWNLKTSGAVEKLTLHAGCPVLYGNKWIANKWFWSYGNVFRLPCSTDQYASMAPLV